MNLESRLGHAFEQAERYEPSPDLFSRVARSIEEHANHRRRRQRVIAFVVALSVGCVGLGVAATFRSPSGGLVMSRWAMELIEAVLMGAIIVTLGPAIRRFGNSFVGDLFRGDSEASTRFLDLLDVAYYLVFSGITLLGVRLAQLGEAGPVNVLLDETRQRLAVLLLVMGLLHSVTIAALPVIGLIRNTTRWRQSHEDTGLSGTNREAQLADRLVRGMFAILTAAIFLGILAAVVATVLVGFG